MRLRWLSARAIGFHVLLVVFVSVCFLAAWWQLHQALGGNSLSWAYTVEWPVFAVIAVLGWWHLIHEDPAERAERASHVEATVGTDEWDGSVVDPRVAAAARLEYSTHVAKMAARDEGAGIWRDPKAPS